MFHASYGTGILNVSGPATISFQTKSESAIVNSPTFPVTKNVHINPEKNLSKIKLAL